MNVYKRGNVYWIKYQANGRVYRQSCRTGNRREAEKFRDRIGTARKMPTLDEAIKVLKILYGSDGGGLLLTDAHKEYLRMAEVLGKTVSEHTATRRRCELESFIRWLGSNRPKIKRVSDVSGVVAADYAAALAASRRSPKTRKNILGELGYIWRMLEKVESSIANPWTNLTPRDTESVRRDAFTPAQEAAVLAAAREIGQDWYGACLVSRHTGLRYGDVAHLKWSEIDFDAGVIRKTPSKTARHGVTVALPMVQALTDELLAIRVRQQAAGHYDANGFVFIIHEHFYGYRNPTMRNKFSFQRVLDKSGVVGNFTFHSWRHTAATRLAEAGANIETRKRILGHTVDDTARHYDHDEHLAESRAAIEAAAKVGC